MPRQARLDAPGALHHVIARGIERAKIFRDESDREDFLGRLGDLSQTGAFRVYAWALLPNHFHLLVRTGRQPLARSMRKLLTGYVVNFNRRHKRVGHLFQNRYKSILCEEEPYLLELTRYIHLNPLRAGLVASLANLTEHRWTGHAVILGRVQRAWQDTETILAYFGKRRKEAAERYAAFVREGLPQGRRPDLVGGGLVRSAGGWSEVLALRRKGLRVASDARILGSGEFMEGLLAEAEARVKETLRLSAKVSDLGSLVRGIAAHTRVTESELRSGSRTRRIGKARKVFAQVAVRRLGYPGAEVARFLGVTTSAVNRAATSEEVPGLDKYL